MSVLEEAIARLAQGQAVEIVRDQQRRLRIYKPREASFYELPKGTHAAQVLPVVLPSCRMVFGEYETYRVEHIARRPGGDLDVVVSATPHDHRLGTYLAFRRDAGVWRPLAGRDRDLESAVHRAEHETRWAGWDSPELAALLATVEAS